MSYYAEVASKSDSLATWAQGYKRAEGNVVIMVDILIPAILSFIFDSLALPSPSSRPRAISSSLLRS